MWARAVSRDENKKIMYMKYEIKYLTLIFSQQQQIRSDLISKLKFRGPTQNRGRPHFIVKQLLFVS
jgi:hypothetical protein